MEYINKKINSDVSCDNSLHQNRFKTTLSFLRLTGITLNITSQSKVYTLFYTVIVVCYYSTCMCALIDIYVYRYDLMQAMKKIRVIIAMFLCAWMHLSLRYATPELAHLKKLRIY